MLVFGEWLVCACTAACLLWIGIGIGLGLGWDRWPDDSERKGRGLRECVTYYLFYQIFADRSQSTPLLFFFFFFTLIVASTHKMPKGKELGVGDLVRCITAIRVSSYACVFGFGEACSMFKSFVMSGQLYLVLALQSDRHPGRC